MTDLFLAFAKPRANREEQFRAWYELGNVESLLKFDGITCIERFEYVGGPLNRIVPEPPGPLLSVYEIARGKIDSVRASYEADRNSPSPTLDRSPDLEASMGWYFRAITPQYR
jgi:hypothetical protein